MVPVNWVADSPSALVLDAPALFGSPDAQLLYAPVGVLPPEPVVF